MRRFNKKHLVCDEMFIKHDFFFFFPLVGVSDSVK